MKKRLILIITLFIPNIAMAASFSSDKYYKNVCGLENVVSENIPALTSGVYNIIRVLIPVILIIMGMIDMFSAVVASDEDKMKKAQNKFFTRAIAAVAIFFILSVVQFAFNQQSVLNKNSMTNCMDCLLSNKSCGTKGKGVEVNKTCAAYTYEGCPKKDTYGNKCKKDKTNKKCVAKSCTAYKSVYKCEGVNGNRCKWTGQSCRKLTKAEKKLKTSGKSNYTVPSNAATCVSTCQKAMGSAKETCLNTCRTGIASLAMSYVGTPAHPYVWGGTTLCSDWKGKSGCGVDCSGFVLKLYEKYGVTDLPRVSSAQANYSKAQVITASKDYKEGDLVFYYTPISHVAIYVGGGKIVHASTPNTGIIMTDICYGGCPSKVIRIMK